MSELSSPVTAVSSASSEESIPATVSEVSSAILSSGRDDSIIELPFQDCRNEAVVNATEDDKCMDRHIKDDLELRHDLELRDDLEMKNDLAQTDAFRENCDETFYGISDLESNEENQHLADLKLLDSPPLVTNVRETDGQRDRTQTQDAGKQAGNLSSSDDDVNKMKHQQVDKSGGQWNSLSPGDDPLTTFTQTKKPVVVSDSQQAHGDFIHNNADLNHPQNPLMTRGRVSRKRPGQRSKISVRRKQEARDPVVMSLVKECLEGKPGTSGERRESLTVDSGEVQDRKSEEDTDKRRPQISNTSGSSDLGVDSNANQKKASNSAELKTTLTTTVDVTSKLNEMVTQFSGNLSQAIHQVTSEEIARLKLLLSQSLKSAHHIQKSLSAAQHVQCADIPVQVEQRENDVVDMKPSSLDAPDKSPTTQSQNSTSVWGDTVDNQNNLAECSCIQKTHVSEKALKHCRFDEELRFLSTQKINEGNVQRLYPQEYRKSHLDKAELFSDESEADCSEIRFKKYSKLRKYIDKRISFHQKQSKKGVLSDKENANREEQIECLDSMEHVNIDKGKIDVKVNDFNLRNDHLSKNCKPHQNNNHCDGDNGEDHKHFENKDLGIRKGRHKKCYLSGQHFENLHLETLCCYVNHDELSLQPKVSDVENHPCFDEISIPSPITPADPLYTEPPAPAPSCVNLQSDNDSLDQTYSINPTPKHNINPTPKHNINPKNTVFTDIDGDLNIGTKIARQNNGHRDSPCRENNNFRHSLKTKGVKQNRVIEKLVRHKVENNLRHYRRAINFLQSVSYPPGQTPLSSHHQDTLGTRSSVDLCNWSLSSDTEDYKCDVTSTLPLSPDGHVICAVSNANSECSNVSHGGDNRFVGEELVKLHKKYDKKKLLVLKNSSYTLVSKRNTNLKETLENTLKPGQECDNRASKNKNVKNVKIKNLQDVKNHINKKIGCIKYASTSPDIREKEKKNIQNNKKPPLPKKKVLSKYGLNYCSPYRSPYRSALLNIEKSNSQQSILPADVKTKETHQVETISKAKLTGQKKSKSDHDRQTGVRLQSNFPCPTGQRQTTVSRLPRYCGDVRKTKPVMDLFLSAHQSTNMNNKFAFDIQGAKRINNSSQLPTKTQSSTDFSTKKFQCQSFDDVTQVLSSRDPPDSAPQGSQGRQLQLFPPRVSTRGRYYPSKNVVCLSVKPINCDISTEKLELQIRVMCGGKKSETTAESVKCPASPLRLTHRQRQDKPMLTLRSGKQFAVDSIPHWPEFQGKESGEKTNTSTASHRRPHRHRDL